MRNYTITLHASGAVYEIHRDVAHRHPEAVHAALGTTSESDLQHALDTMSVDDWYQGGQHLGADIDGLEMRYDDDGLEARVEHDGHIYIASVMGPDVSISEDWVWAGTGRWDGQCISDCPAVLPEEVYEALEDALAESAQ